VKASCSTSSAQGQGVLSIVGLTPLRAEVDAAIATLAAASPAPAPARHSPAA